MLKDHPPLHLDSQKHKDQKEPDNETSQINYNRKFTLIFNKRNLHGLSLHKRLAVFFSSS